MSNLKNILNSFDFKQELDSKIWDKKGSSYTLRPDIKKKLLGVTYEFYDSLKVDLVISDIIFTGSLANFNWSNYSDVDIHLVADFNQFDKEDIQLYEELFTLKKTIFNDKHDITIYGYDVELYVQDENEHRTENAGVYSLLNDEWIVEPQKGKKSIDKNLIKNKSKAWIKEIDTAIDLAKEESLEDAKKIIKRIREKINKYRVCGLQKGGEFSVENLVFKVLRRSGYIDKIKDLKDRLIDKNLSLNEDEVKDPNLSQEKKAEIVEPDVEKFFNTLRDIDTNIYQQEAGSYTYKKDVESIQIALDMLGYPLPRFGVDGKFGPETAKAVNDFKKDNKIDDSNLKKESISNKNYFISIIREVLLKEKKLIKEGELGSPLPTKLGFNKSNGFQSAERPQHNGVDYYAKSGTEALAIADGIVTKTAKDSKKCGGTIVINHGEYTSSYCHIKEISVSEGEKVTKGQKVGLTGGAKDDPGRGNSQGAHLHFVLRKNGVPVDPNQYLEKGVVTTQEPSASKPPVDKSSSVNKGVAFVSPIMVLKLIEKLIEKKITSLDIENYTKKKMDKSERIKYKDEKIKMDFVQGDVKIQGNFNAKQIENIKIMINKLNEIGITNPYAQVGVLSVIGKETNFIPKNEVCYNTTPNSRIRNKFGKRVSKFSDEELDVLKQDCKEFFDTVYGKDAGIKWKTGNTEKGDGYKYRGRGFNQITFKHNYKKIGDMIGMDLVSNPEILNDVNVAAEAAVKFFTANAKGQIPNFNNKEDAINFFADINGGGGVSSHRDTAQESGKRFDVVV